MIKWGITKKYKAAAMSLALAMAALTGCGDSGKSGGGNALYCSY